MHRVWLSLYRLPYRSCSCPWHRRFWFCTHGCKTGNGSRYPVLVAVIHAFRPSRMKRFTAASIENLCYSARLAMWREVRGSARHPGRSACYSRHKQADDREPLNLFRHKKGVWRHNSLPEEFGFILPWQPLKRSWLKSFNDGSLSLQNNQIKCKYRYSLPAGNIWKGNQKTNTDNDVIQRGNEGKTIITNHRSEAKTNKKYIIVLRVLPILHEFRK